MIKFLIDECISPELAKLAIKKGYYNSKHVNWLGLNTNPDHVLMNTILNDDWTFVTRNSKDFRPNRGELRQSPCYVSVGLHAGLVCLNPPPDSDNELHLKYFLVCINYIDGLRDLINKVLEVSPSESNEDNLIVDFYDLPSED